MLKKSLNTGRPEKGKFLPYGTRRGKEKKKDALFNDNEVIRFGLDYLFLADEIGTVYNDSGSNLNVIMF